jgi:predicted site-specific integrase-resolvase
MGFIAVVEMVAHCMSNKHEELCKTEFAREVGVAVTTLERWILKQQITPRVQVAGRMFFHRQQLAEARKLKQPRFGKR